MHAKQQYAERAKVVAVARTWLGTPYHNCAMIKGAGVDCAMLIKAVFEEAGLEAPIEIQPYSPMWYLFRSEEKYLEYVLSRAQEITQAQARPADLVVYKFGRCFSHGAIIIDPGWPKIIHAFRQAGKVTLDNGDMGDISGRERKFFTRKAWAPT